MTQLPGVSGKELIKFLQKRGFSKLRQRGSHVSLQKQTPDRTYRTVVPMHNDLSIGTLLNILRQCGISKEEFIEKYKKR